MRQLQLADLDGHALARMCLGDHAVILFGSAISVGTNQSIDREAVRSVPS
jgi:hypothetical protein